MYAMYFLFVVFLYCNLLQLTLVQGLLLLFLYIHSCVIFNTCIQTLNVPTTCPYHMTLQHVPTSCLLYMILSHMIDIPNTSVSTTCSFN